MSSTGAIGLIQLSAFLGGAAAEAAPTALGALSSLLASQGDTYTGVASQLTSTDSVQVSLGLERLRVVLLSGNARLLTDLAAIIQPEEALSDETAIRTAVDLNERRLGGSIGRTFFIPAQAGLATSVYPEETVDCILTALGELHELRIVSGLAAFIGGRGEIDRAAQLYHWALLAAEQRNDRTTWIQDVAALGDLYRRSGYAIIGDLIQSRAACLVPETSLRSLETIIAEWEAIGRSFETLLDRFINNEIPPTLFLQKANPLRSEMERVRQGLKDDPRFCVFTRTYLHASTLEETRRQVELLSREYMDEGKEVVVEIVEIPSGETYLLLRETELRTARAKASLSFSLASVAALPKEDPMRRFHEVRTAVTINSEIVLGLLGGIEDLQSRITGTVDPVTKIEESLDRMVPALEYSLEEALDAPKRDPNVEMSLAVSLQSLLSAAQIILAESRGEKAYALSGRVAGQRQMALALFGRALTDWRRVKGQEELQLPAAEELSSVGLTRADRLYLQAQLKQESGRPGDAIQDLREALDILERPQDGQASQVKISEILPLLVRLLAEGGSPDEALRLARECADRHPEDIRLAYAYAEELERADRFLEAIRIYYRCVGNGHANDPFALLARLNIAEIFLQFSMWDLAIAELRVMNQGRTVRRLLDTAVEKQLLPSGESDRAIAGIQRHFFGKAAAALRGLISYRDIEIIDPALEAAIAAWQEMSRDPQMWVLDPQQLREFADLVDLIGSQRPARIDILILQAELAQALGEGEKAESLSRRAQDVAPQSLYLRDHLARFRDPVSR